MKIAIASDHGGYQIKHMINEYLKSQQHSVADYGTHSDTSCDYPDFAIHVCAEVQHKTSEFGILICGTGIGMCMIANRNPYIRAGLCKDPETATLTRQHNDANVLCLGARTTDADDIIPIIQAFITTEFEGGRHANRIKKFSI